MKRYALAIDLINSPALIAEHEYWHKTENGWPEIKQSITEPGVIDMQIYRTGNRLLMIMETTEEFGLAKKAEMDATNPIVQEWETLMTKFQKVLPWAKNGEKWVMMDKIFQL